jgi:hypothetical protein
MRFVRAYFDVETGECAGIQEQVTPFVAAALEIPGRTLRCVDVGLVPDDWTAARLHDVIEQHSLASTHEDAPQWKLKADVDEVPKVTFSPCAEADIVSRVIEQGADRLPEQTKTVLREVFKDRDDVSLTVLRGMGFTFQELKNHPRARANKLRVDADRIAAELAAQVDREAARLANQHARINRRLNKGTP